MPHLGARTKEEPCPRHRRAGQEAGPHDIGVMPFHCGCCAGTCEICRPELDPRRNAQSDEQLPRASYQAQSDDDKEEKYFELTPKLSDLIRLRHAMLGPSRLSQDKASVLVCKLIKLVLVTQERHGSLNAMKLDNEEAKADHQHLAAACTKHLDFDFDFRPMWLRVGGCKQSRLPTQPRLLLPKRLRPGGRTLRPTQPTFPPPKWLRLSGRPLRPTQPTVAPPMSLRAGVRIQSLRPTQPAFPPPTWLRTTAAGSASRPHPPSFPPDD